MHNNQVILIQFKCDYLYPILEKLDEKVSFEIIYCKADIILTNDKWNFGIVNFKVM